MTVKGRGVLHWRRERSFCSRVRRLTGTAHKWHTRQVDNQRVLKIQHSATIKSLQADRETPQDRPSERMPGGATARTQRARTYEKPPARTACLPLIGLRVWSRDPTVSIDLLSSVAKSKVPQQEPLTAKISSCTFLHNSHRFLKISIRRKDSVICPSITVIYLSLDNETAQKWVEKATVYE